MKFPPITVAEIVASIASCKVVGDTSILIHSVCSILDGHHGALTWLNPNRTDKAHLIAATAAQCVVMASDEDFEPRPHQVFLKCPNPKLTYVRLLRLLIPQAIRPGVHPTADVHPSASIHESASVGAYAVIEACEIGPGSVIGSNVFIGDGTKIGQHVNIAAGVVIGADGFGYVDDENGVRLRFPHLGHVEIEDYVDIGANTCIDRGTLGRTLIKVGAKIDNLVHIAHNVTVGRNAMIIASTMIGGSTVIGDGVWVAPGATVRDSIAIGAGATVGIGALVTKSVPDGEIWAGHPARPFPGTRSN
jgi:UDP-3-O-[3-hydroxymyristoyl] glucosamine N-acyltransferase